MPTSIPLDSVHFQLTNDDRLVPRARNIVRRATLTSSVAVVSRIVELDVTTGDVLDDWGPDPPGVLGDLDLTDGQLRRLQLDRLFLRNRRIVSGYELVDEKLRSKIGPGCPPTWLTVGKWTARTIGDLLQRHLYRPRRSGLVHGLVESAFGLLPPRDVATMGRIFVLGNREIFAQVAGAIARFNDLTFAEPQNENFASFLSTHAGDLLGRLDPNVPDELLFPMISTSRDPLSDSMLRALYCYYRAMDPTAPDDRTAWVLSGNLYLAAYEQIVAQIYVDLALGARPAKRLEELLASRSILQLSSRRSTLRPERPRDMLLERGLFGRLIDLVTAASLTQFALSIAVGTECADQEHDPARCRVFAPSRALHGLNQDPVGRMLIDSAGQPVNSQAADELRRLWFALDRAEAQAADVRVRDWRNYPARISYIANLFAVALLPDAEALFTQPVFSDQLRRRYLAGFLPAEHGVKLRPEQVTAAELAPNIRTAGGP